jgi:hypothetical protein
MTLTATHADGDEKRMAALAFTRRNPAVVWED